MYRILFMLWEVNSLKKLYLFLLGFIPLGLGCIINWLITQFPNSALPFGFIAIGFLLFWGFIGFQTYIFKESALISICIVNLVGLSALIFNLYQEIILGHYLGNLLSICAQLFYLPILNISYTLTFWSGRVWSAYIVGFFLMCLVYFIGFKAKKQRAK